ncbi:type II toxin-antitoxin system HicB family antitoxin [Desulfovibrio sp. JC010]|uniref:type II toxin-antitoxin system HicB family antitoxin n=1 Tax=Desulfovibrio sp. JC010 TaxID=2593641 RepID=UPI0013D7C512|nr:toxin-antitoxin system HicB family antitoxin [Desulfovibrio sp. JC010]NDV26108.1 toxin-antitoxin system HicB family antitoxin [Desulfovibrio sp. JC010]
MHYKGYYAKIKQDVEDQIFIGHVIGIKDIVGFHGKSESELEQAFHEAVDNYLAACDELNQSPKKTSEDSFSLNAAMRGMEDEVESEYTQANLKDN